jgi:hypothetical protein
VQFGVAKCTMVGIEREGGQEREHNTKGFGRKLVMK